MSSSPWKHFSLEELSCRHCGEMKMNADFMEKVEKLRLHYGAPMPLSSAYRCPAHELAVSGREGDTPHKMGRAVDVLIYGDRAVRFIESAVKLGLFTGFGFNQKGDQFKRFIHIDDMKANELPGGTRPWIWTY